jgi:Fe-S-cluster-containing hydrogenase component 2
VKPLLLLIGLALCLCLTITTVANELGTKTVISKMKCVGCGDCVRVCPLHAVSVVRGKAYVDPEKCVGCRICVISCSYGAPK